MGTGKERQVWCEFHEARFSSSEFFRVPSQKIQEFSRSSEKSEGAAPLRGKRLATRGWANPGRGVRQELNRIAAGPAFVASTSTSSMHPIRRSFWSLVSIILAAVPLGRVAYPAASDSSPPVRVLLFSGQNNHDWKTTTPKLTSILTDSGRFTVQVTEHPEQCKADVFSACDVVVSDWNAWGNAPIQEWPFAVRAAFLEFIRRGGGYVSVHAGSSSFYDWPEYQQIGGMYWNLKATSHGAPHEFPVEFVADHPITRGLAPFRTKDELWLKPGVHPEARVLATGDGQPLAVTTSLGKGRGFSLLLGHAAEFMDTPGFQALLRRGTEWAASGAVSLSESEPITPAASRFPLRVSDSKRHLVDAQGKPFLVVGDTAWSLIAQLKPEEIAAYLEDRQRRGFNAIIVSLIEHKFADQAPATIDGTEPFLAPGDFARPNPAYLERAHNAVLAAHQRGLSVWLCPAYLGWAGGDEGFWRDIMKAGRAALRTYATLVGQRFEDLPNIVWMIGGDYALPENERWVGHELALGLRDGGARQLITAHGGQTTAVDTFGDQPWLAIDTVYRYQDDLWRPLQANWHREPTRPYVMIESAYEGEHQATPARLRAQAWWSMTSGACGQFFGNNPIWYFDGRAYEFAKQKSAPHWRAALDLPGSRDITRLAAFFTKLDWSALQPDLENRVLVVGMGEGKDRATCVASSDGRLAVIYVPSARTLGVNPSRFTGPVVARWFDPTSGEFRGAPGTVLGGSPAELELPGRNAAGDSDWVLLLEAAKPR